MSPVIEDRVAWLDTIHLKSGKHDSLDRGTCVMEAVSYIAGEPFTDHPECVDLVIAAFGRAWNDGLPDDDARDRWLKPFLVRMVGTASTPAIRDQRAFMASDWAVRIYTPTWLRLIGLNGEAVALEQLPALSSVALCKAAMPTIKKAQQKADAAWAAAGDAAGAAAGDAAGDAARAAAGAAARAAVRDALAPTVEKLQASAAELLDRMIRLTEDKPRRTRKKAA